MKQLFTYLFLVISAAIIAQAPQSIPYQAVVRNTDGSVMASTAITITFKIHDASATGNVVYEENHAATTNSQGLISLNVGNGTVASGTFSGINWGSGSKFLHVLMNAGSGVVDLGTQQMMSVPYALYAEDVNVRVSATGDTLFIGSNSSIVPGISPPISNGIFTEGQGVTDIDGNKYRSVVIGQQEWMAENLKTTKFCNGESLTEIDFTNPTWYNTSQPRYAYPDMYGANNIIYGKLYNENVVRANQIYSPGNVCPCGWHVPSVTEFTVLQQYLGGQQCGNKLRDVGYVFDGTGYWVFSTNTQNSPANNESGFSALPAGTISSSSGSPPYGSSQYSFGRETSFLTSTQVNSQIGAKVYRFSLGHDSNYFTAATSSLSSPASIRCIKD